MDTTPSPPAAAKLLREAGIDLPRGELTPVPRDSEPERVLVHGDVGFHNMAIDAEDRVVGLFDYGDACWSDRHLGFRYLTFGRDAFQLLGAATDAYTPAGGRPIDRRRVLLHNAAAAVGFLAWRDGVAAGEKC